jgi:hypothetical protein
LNYYRNLQAPFAGALVTVPALYMVGEYDVTLACPGMKELVADLPRLVPQLRRTIVLPDCGHWTQQERAEKVNAAMIAFPQEIGAGVRASHDGRDRGRDLMPKSFDGLALIRGQGQIIGSPRSSTDFAVALAAT